jgi:hypothetical protein
LVTARGWIVALQAPDSVIAVTPLDQGIGYLRQQLETIASTTCIALGTSRASIGGGVVDGPALDVEGWAPYPLPTGLWVADNLRPTA